MTNPGTRNRKKTPSAAMPGGAMITVSMTQAVIAIERYFMIHMNVHLFKIT
jgi:hypothetical protein